MKTIIIIAALVLIANAIAGIVRVRRGLRAARRGVDELAGRMRKC